MSDGKSCYTCLYEEMDVCEEPCSMCIGGFVFDETSRAWKPKIQETRPSYYPPVAGVDSIRIMEAFNFNLGNAMKYIWRCGQKPGEEPAKDLRKAIQYLEFEIARLERGDDD